MLSTALAAAGLQEVVLGGASVSTGAQTRDVEQHGRLSVTGRKGRGMRQRRVTLGGTAISYLDRPVIGRRQYGIGIGIVGHGSDGTAVIIGNGVQEGGRGDGTGQRGQA